MIILPTLAISIFFRETCRRACPSFIFVWVVFVVVAARPFPFPPRIRTYLEESLFLTRAHTFTSTVRYLSDQSKFPYFSLRRICFILHIVDFLKVCVTLTIA